MASRRRTKRAGSESGPLEPPTSCRKSVGARPSLIYITRRWDFPADKSIIRPEAVIFHADPNQTLIKWNANRSYFSSGDLGDVIAALPIIRQQGGGTFYLGPAHDPIGAREKMTRARFESIRPLLELQPYVQKVDFMESFDQTKIDNDLSTFRTTRHIRAENLALWQGRHIGREYMNLDPWLEVDARQHGRVICSRSGRYVNEQFPWAKIVKHYGDQVLFVGHPSEHAHFQSLVGRNVEHSITRDVLELAQLLKGAAIQFSNQSLPWWLGAAMGKKVIQESWPNDPNSVIERPALTYTRNPDEIRRLDHSLR